MNRVVVALGAACVLALAGCSGAGTGSGEAESTTVTSITAVPEFAAVGDTVPVVCDGGECEGSLEVEEVLLGGQCAAGGEADVAEGETLVQVRGVLSASDGEVYLDTPVVWDKESFKNTGKPADACERPSGYEPWPTGASAGEKVRVYGAFVVPEAAVMLGIADAKFDLAKVGAAETSVAAPATQPSVVTEQTIPEAPTEEAEPVIGFTGAPGQEAPQVMDKQIASCGDPSIHETGTTFFTDGTSGWTQQCASQMWPAQEAMIAEQEADAPVEGPVDGVEEDYE
ncbi:Uncharacterised protein [Corynebacterium imitans]|uniref:Secreted protein n=1 Tax=Corynebacterium imitans TaxID=156978 RepID=A0A240A3B0_9CORY|nr:hypothetical protein [Corynebacterium imitans]SNV77922.1 Uncharacterised protein [Corynebacterium imitans]